MPKQQAADFSKIASLARVVTLESVCWRELSAKRNVEQALLPEEMLWRGKHESSGLRDLEAKQIVVLAQFRFQACRSDEDVIAEVAGTLALRYSVEGHSLRDFDAKLVQGFAETNGIYNAWPYWRETLQSMADRIGLHGVIAPLFRLVPTPPKSSEAPK